ncbi:MAG: ATP-binding protein [Planctomycetota bacterium]
MIRPLRLKFLAAILGVMLVTFLLLAVFLLTLYLQPVLGARLRGPLEMLTIILWIMVLGTLALVFIVYLLVHRLVLRPMQALLEGSRRVAAGDVSRPVPFEERVDEMGELTRAFNEMMAEVRRFREDAETEVAAHRNRAEAAQKHLIVAERLAALGTLAAGVAHEINNPLSGMMNAARRLRDLPPGDPKAAEYVALIGEGLERIEGTVRRMLRFSRRDIQPQPVDLREVAAGAAGFLRHRLEARRVRFECRIPEDLRVFGDPRELEQVFLNLLGNAADAVAEGGRVEVEGEIVPPGPGRRSARVIVRDDGAGMTPEALEHAFDPFFTTKPEGKGTGLGLSIVHTIITEHGGTVALESEAGKGTTVRIVLPLVEG